MRVAFTIPGEPVGKGRARFGNGRTYTPAKTVAFENLVTLAAQEAMRGQEPTREPVQLHVAAYLSIPASASKVQQKRMRDGLVLPAKRPDLDNIVKAVSDGCNKVVFHDDAQVCDSRESKRFSDRPRLEVTITTIQPEVF